MDRIYKLAEPMLASEGFEPVEIQYRRERGGWVLRLFIDRLEPIDGSPAGPGSGVTLDDCVTVSRELGRILDVEDAVSGGYTLEVSSPGLDRPLTRPAHFQRFTGRKIKVKAAGPEGNRIVTGRLLGLEDGQIRLETGDDVLSVPYEQAVRVRLVPDVNWAGLNERKMESVES